MASIEVIEFGRLTLYISYGQYSAFRRKSKSMKPVVVFLAAAFLICCSSMPVKKNSTERLGLVDRNYILENAEYPEFKTVYDSSRITPEFIEMITKVQDSVDVTVFLGMWCSDSKREVPRFLKIVDLAGMSPERIRFYSLDRSKKSPARLEAQYHIERVPTFILLRGDREIGRIIEVPRTTMEADLLSILAAASPPR